MRELEKVQRGGHYAVCKATKAKVILSTNCCIAALVKTDDEIMLFYSDQHYEPLITLNQLSRSVNDTIINSNSDICLFQVP